MNCYVSISCTFRVFIDMECYVNLLLPLEFIFLIDIVSLVPRALLGFSLLGGRLVYGKSIRRMVKLTTEIRNSFETQSKIALKLKFCLTTDTQSSKTL